MDSTTRRLLLAFGLFLVVTLSFLALMGPGFAGSDQTGQRPFGRA